MKEWLKQQAKEWISALWTAAGVITISLLAGFMFAYGATKGYQAAVKGVNVVSEQGCVIYYYVPLTGTVPGEDGCE